MHFPAHRFFTHIEPDALWQWITRQRWFGGKARTVTEWRVTHFLEADYGLLAALRVTYTDGAETYTLPLAWVPAASERATITHHELTLCDAAELPAFQAWLFRTLDRSPAFHRLFPTDELPPSRMLTTEQSNTSFIFGERMFVKWFRRLVQGPNPDEELTRFLTEHTTFRNVPPYCGALHWRGASLALAAQLTPNQGDAWPLALHCAKRHTTHFPAALLGQRTAELHNALATATGPDLSPEPLTHHDLDELRAEIARLHSTNRATLTTRLHTLNPATAALARRYLSAPLHTHPMPLPEGAIKTRTHGDYHLGQVLWTGTDFVIIDFEGEPTRTLPERRAKRSPLRDIAGMLRSFHYAAPTDPDWANAHCANFLQAWKTTAPTLTTGLPLLPHFIKEKALYELSYELNNRPDWAHIPLRALAPALHEQ